MLKRGVGFKNQFWPSERFLGAIWLKVFGRWGFRKILGPALVQNCGFCAGLRGFRIGLRDFALGSVVSVPGLRCFRAGLRGFRAGLRNFLARLQRFRDSRNIARG